MKSLIPPFSRQRSAGPNTLRGMGYMLVMAVCASVLNATVKYLSAEIHPFEITFFRALFGFLAFVPLFVRHGWAPLRTERLGLHAVRGVLTGIGLLILFWGLGMTPLAKAQALSFSTPLFATVLAFTVLGEKIRFRRIAALVTGFVGTVVVLRPGMIEIGAGPLLILLSAIAFGGMMIAIKMLARTETSTTITVYMALFTTPLTFLAALFVWQTPTWSQLGVMAAIGFLSTFIHLCLAQAIKEADISAVLPVNFTSLIWASVIGFAVFGETPDAGTWIGGTIIFAAVVFIAFRERPQQGETPPPASD
ncbi:MAG: DMT family transporter [Rhodospirillales bacterium]|nr:DMT family transporter [Rhodospirillales bacterium]